MNSNTEIPNSGSLNALRKEMLRCLSREDLELLCADLNIVGSLKPAPLENEILELIERLHKNDHLETLAEHLSKIRPTVNWTALIQPISVDTKDSEEKPLLQTFRPHDVYSRYEDGLTILDRYIPDSHAERQAFDVHRRHMLDNIAKARRVGDTPTREVERLEIFDALNIISYQVTGRSLNDWMRLDETG